MTNAAVTVKQWSQGPEAGGSKVSNRAQTLGFRRAEFGSFRELVGETPWESAQKEKGSQ